MRILCVTSVRNEAPYLLEWIAHHRGAGVSDFLIYSNDCEDGTTALLDALHNAGVICHQPQVIEDKKSPQWQALRAAWKHELRKDCDWAIVCDVDEFVNIQTGANGFADLINNVPAETDAIALPWRLFGSGGTTNYTDDPVTKRFMRSAEPDLAFPISATFFKTLVRTQGPFNQFGVHRPKQKNAEREGLPNWVDGSGTPMPSSFAANEKRLSLFGLPHGRDLAECNHYSLKSAEEFLVKRARGLPNRSQKAIDLSYWVDRNFNDVPNSSIGKMAPKTKAAHKELLEIPGVKDLHGQGVDWHHAKFQDVIRDRKSHHVFSQIAIAGDSKAPSEDLMLQIVRWYQQLNAD